LKIPAGLYPSNRFSGFVDDDEDIDDVDVAFNVGRGGKFEEDEELEFSELLERDDDNGGGEVSMGDTGVVGMPVAEPPPDTVREFVKPCCCVCC